VGVGTWAIGGAPVGVGVGDGVLAVGVGVGDGTVATFWEGRTVGPVCTVVPKPRAIPARAMLTIPRARTRRARWATVTTIGALLSAGFEGEPGGNSS
jgi:hypothetical protein